jgi:glycerophosphoryl diester phosphodiesterase
MAETKYRRIGHKGADAIAPGNTLESFEAAVEEGVDMIEFDVLRDRDERLVIAHDYPDAASRRPLDLTDALDALCEPPLDEVEFDCDLKLPGREPELAGALAGHGLLDRAMVSTMEVESIIKLRKLEPGLRLGWTVPKTRRDWTRDRWAAPALVAGLMALRRRMPKTIAARAPELGVKAVWAYHRVVTPKLVAAAHDAGIELFAWTVDDLEEIAELEEMGVDGIVSNDPRLFRGEAPAPADEDGKPESKDGKPKSKDGKLKSKDGKPRSKNAKPKPEDAKEIAEELAEDAEPEPEAAKS